jgi:HAD superfamily hydrolase (TIGR01509 family)
VAPVFIFDLAEVLCAGFPGVEVQLGQVFNVPAEQILPGVRGQIMNDYCRGRMSEEDFWSRIMAANDWSGDVEAARAALLKNLHRKVPGTEDILRTIAAAGHDVYLLSDHGREWIDYLLEVHDFFKVFKRHFWSFDLGAIKQQAVTFEQVLKRIGQPDPANVIFIDDNPGNIAVAGGLGIDAIRFIGAEDLSNQLARRGVL